MQFNKKVLIDTSIMIDLLRGVYEAMNWIDKIEPENRLLSFITVAELIAGCRNQDEQKKIESEIKGYVLAHLDIEGCKQGLVLYKNFHLSHGVGFLDCLIAATAYRNNIQIVTLNDKHFKQMTGISIIKPY